MEHTIRRTAIERPYKVHQSLGYCSTKTGKTKSAGEKAASTYTLIHWPKEEQN